jgi:hypothetical protein
MLAQRIEMGNAVAVAGRGADLRADGFEQRIDRAGGFARRGSGLDKLRDSSLGLGSALWWNKEKKS